MSLKQLPELSSLQRVFLHGFGVEGRAALPWIQKTCPAEIIVIGNNIENQPDGLKTVSEQNALALPAPDLYLRSPGIPPKNLLMQAMTKAGIATTTPTGYWLDKAAHGKIIAITGTKGKSTSAALLQAILKEAGCETALIGNIGAPPFASAIGPETICIAELSSYMMHDLPQVIDFHVITNLYTEHTDWHGGHDAYAAAKLSPFLENPQQKGLYGENLTSALGDHKAAKPVEDIAQYEDGKLFHGLDWQIELENLNEIFTAPSMAKAADCALASALMVAEDWQLSPSEEILAAAARAFRGFKGLPHRQSIISQAGDRLWVDDALATVPEATLSAITRFQKRPLHILIGGKDRGQSFGDFFAALPDEASIRFYQFGEIATRFTADAERAGISCAGDGNRPYEDMESAIKAAFEASAPGDAILFSPAAPTEEKHGNFASRARLFADLAKNIS